MSQDGKPGRSKAVRAPRSPDGAKLKTSVGLSVEAKRILVRHSTETGASLGEIVEGLILEHVTRYRVSAMPRGVRVAEEPGAEVA